ncbi:hypothetical protein D3C72_1046780 [compost metagenome]
MFQKVVKRQVRDMWITVQQRVCAQFRQVRMDLKGDGVGCQPGSCIWMTQQPFQHGLSGGQ